MSSNAYSSLLHHLHRAQPVLPLETIQSALAFQIANLNPLPTPLAATAITSPLFLSTPFTLSRLHALSASFRHALHLKFTLLSGPRFSFFERSISTRLSQWIMALMKGLQGGNALLKLAAASGVLLALEDLKAQARDKVNLDPGSKSDPGQNPVSEATRAKVEDEVVIAFAEVMDEEGVGREWESEFQKTDAYPSSEDLISPLTLSLILASLSLPLVAPQKLKALPLPALSELLTACITETFNAGDFLHESPTSVSLKPHIASLSRLEALVLSLLLSSRARAGLACAQDTLNRVRDMSAVVEGGIAALLQGKGLDVTTTATATSTSTTEASAGPWLTLKTLLFSTIMLSDAVLSTCIYIPPSSYRITSPTSSLPTPASLALTTLLTLSHLSFILSQFGGISSLGGGGGADEPFKELRKTAYLALDILAHRSDSLSSSSSSSPELSSESESAVANAAERFVHELCRGSLSSSSSSRPRPVSEPSTSAHMEAEETIELAKMSFTLACIEQLVPVLGVKCLRDPVWALVEQNLDLRSGSSAALGEQSPSSSLSRLSQLRRETYESAHSVVLAMFAANASNADAATGHEYRAITEKEKGKGRADSESDFASEMTLAAFCERLVPFYTRCLLENSVQGKLSTPQLRIAYSALVRSASSSISPSPGSDSDSESSSPSQFVLAWYCIEELLNAIRSRKHDLENDNSGSIATYKLKEDWEHIHRLYLTLVSCVSAVPLSLLGRVMNELRGILVWDGSSVAGVAQADVDDLEASTRRADDRAELVRALHREVLEVVGDLEKMYVMKWWMEFSNEGGRYLIAKL